MNKKQENKIILLRMMKCSSGKTHEKQEVYSVYGVLGCIPGTTYKDPPRVLIRGDS